MCYWFLKNGHYELICEEIPFVYSDIISIIFENKIFRVDCIDDEKIRIVSSHKDIKKQIEDYLHQISYENYFNISDVNIDWSFTNNIYHCYITFNEYGIESFDILCTLFLLANKIQKKYKEIPVWIEDEDDESYNKRKSEMLNKEKELELELKNFISSCKNN